MSGRKKLLLFRYGGRFELTREKKRLKISANWVMTKFLNENIFK
jgi:hypothetical protein